jgi:WhiB family redox-sensing transcriptional regulator
VSAVTAQGFDDLATGWQATALCAGQTGLFFAPPGERPEARARREAKARQLCHICPVLDPCRIWARSHREYGFWGGESEEDRAAAGYRVDMPVGRVARYPRSENRNVSNLSLRS